MKKAETGIVLFNKMLLGTICPFLKFLWYLAEIKILN